MKYALFIILLASCTLLREDPELIQEAEKIGLETIDDIVKIEESK